MCPQNCALQYSAMLDKATAPKQVTCTHTHVNFDCRIWVLWSTFLNVCVCVCVCVCLCCRRKRSGDGSLEAGMISLQVHTHAHSLLTFSTAETVGELIVRNLTEKRIAELDVSLNDLKEEYL